MKRPLAALTAAALAALAVVVPTATATAADTGGFTATAKWVNNTVTVVYSWDGLPVDAVSGGLTISADSTTIAADHAARTDRIATASRGNGHGKTVKVAATTEVCTETAAAAPASTPTGDPILTPAPTVTPTPAAAVSTCTTEVIWSKTVTRHLVKAKHGQVSAATLLGKLKVAKETRTGSYARSKFKLWLDANHDGENTRAEVLKAESKKKVTENSHHTVTTGRWVSPYDGKTFTVASKLDIDHLVPLEEAWTSGAYAWSGKKRSAYANDLGYGPSLIAVSLHQNRSKGDEEPNAYLPPKTSYTCTYVRNWIAVKYRWGLKVDSAEKTALKTDLAEYCINPNVTKPGKPNITALVGTPEPKPTHSGGTGTGSSSVYYKNCAAVRAAGKAPLYAGQPGYATPRLDRDGDGVACE